MTLPGRVCLDAGATDTTMLIWKVIAANPGIDRAGIWAKVEHGIPEGYALRRYTAYPRHKRSGRDSSLPDLASARGYVLTDCLKYMRKHANVTWEGDGGDRRYTAARQPRYKGNAETVDETGTKAAQHMALVDAWRTIGGLVKRPK